MYRIFFADLTAASNFEHTLKKGTIVVKVIFFNDTYIMLFTNCIKYYLLDFVRGVIKKVEEIHK